MTGTVPETASATIRADGTVALSGVLTFETVPAVYAESRGWFEQPRQSLALDLADVGRADSAGLALLVEWLRRARERGVTVRFVNVPEQLASLARVHGLSQMLGLNREHASADSRA